MSEQDLRKIPNVGPAVARMLIRLGVQHADDLRGRDAEQLFDELCDLDGRRHDPCLLDTFTAAVDFANGALARPWWHYSRARKAQEAAMAANSRVAESITSDIDDRSAAGKAPN